MSNDLVDDLHAAEDTVGALGALLRRLRQLSDHVLGTTAAATLSAAIEEAENYCRASCAEHSADAHGASDCGCPCHA